MNKQIKLLLVISFLLFVLKIVSAQPNSVDLYFFYGQGCPHCAQAEQFLAQLNKQYPNLNIKSFEVFYHQENRQIYFAMANAYKINVAEVPVPGIFIGEKSFVGYNNFIGSQIRNEVLRCLNQRCPSPIEKIQLGQNNQTNNQLSTKQIIVGWIVIILIILAIIFLLIKLFLKKKK